MSTKHNWRKPRYVSLIVNTILFVVTLALLVFFAPRESKFGYIYEENRPWRYQQLIASFDFPIYKSEAELNAERDSIKRNFEPYYQLDTLTAQRQISAMRQKVYSGGAPGFDVAYLPRLVELLGEVYDRGVLPADDVAELKKRGVNIRVLRGKQAGVREPDNVFTPRTAYEYVIQADAHSVNPMMISRLHLYDYIVPNLKTDQAKNKAELDGQLAAVADNIGLVQAGQFIIGRGQLVNAHQVRILDSMRRASEQRLDPTKSFWFVLLGQTCYIAILLSILLFYLKLFRRDYLASLHTMLLLFSLVVIFPLITYLMMTHQFFSVFLVPYAIVPIFIRLFMDSRTAFVTMVVVTLLSAMALHAPFEFVLLQIVTGVVVIYSLRELTERSQLLKTVLMAMAAGLIISITYDLSQGLGFAAFDQSRSIFVLIGGLMMLFAYPLMYVVEKVFGFTSNVTLIELTNINHPLLRRMSKEAQGTFNHSMQVANLAAEVADKIGAKPQLVRTGALYHDIGKMLNPAFFTENQSGVNPHDNLSEERSAQIIISHVTDGLRLADKYHLPKVIRDFICTHHGEGLTKYFFIQYSNKHPEEKVDEAAFRYPGPNPKTVEQAILMMCDSVEAASRSLKEYTEENISALVNRIIDAQLAAGFFRECPITFRDIADAKRCLIDSLKTIYHTRIAYPELNREQPPQKLAVSHISSLFGRDHKEWKL